MDDTTLKTLKDVLRAELKGQDQTLSSALQLLSENKNWSLTVRSLRPSSAEEDRTRSERLYLLDALWEITAGNAGLLSFLALKSGTDSLNTFAPKYYVIPLSGEGYNLTEQQRADFQSRLFCSAPTAVLKGLVVSGSIPTGTPNGTPAGNQTAKDRLLEVFDYALSQGFDIRMSSAKELLVKFRESSEIEEKDFIQASQTFYSVQRLQAVTITPDQIGLLLQSGYDSAAKIARPPWDAFEKRMKSKKIPVEQYRRIRDEAEVIAARNEQVWLGLLASRTTPAPKPGNSSELPTSKAKGGLTQTAQATQATQVTQTTQATQATQASQDNRKAGETTSSPPKDEVASTVIQQVSLETLFREVDDVACEHCCSVISPSAYYVDLLKMLQGIEFSKNAKSVSLLDNLFDRRPDLGHLELSCANTNTEIPYIILANEVMESFVRFLQPEGSSKPSISGTNTSEDGPHIVPEMEHAIDFDLYQTILRKEVFPPIVFPYNLATQYTRTVFQMIGHSRLDLLENFRSDQRLNRRILNSSRLTPENLEKLVSDAYSRATAAEALGLQLEDFVIITHEAFHSLALLEEEHGHLSPEDYRNLVGVPDVCKLWGYNDNLSMNNIDESKEMGLTFIQAQLLPRSGLSFQELLEILKTQFIGCRLIVTVAGQKERFSGKGREMRIQFTGILSEDPRRKLKTFDDLMAFIRLYRKISWSISDLDVAISSMHRREEYSQAEVRISPRNIEELAAISKLQHLTGLNIKSLLSLWADIDIYGPQSLYRTLFVNQSYGADQKLFSEKSFGSGDVEIHEGVATLKAALDLTDDQLVQLCEVSGVKQTQNLNLTSVSQLYRHNLISSMLGLTLEELQQFVELLELKETFFTNPCKTLDFMQQWKQMLSAGWTPRDILYVTQGVDSQKPGDTTMPQPELVTRSILELWQGVRSIKGGLRGGPNSDIVQAVLTSLFEPERARLVEGLLDGNLIAMRVLKLEKVPDIPKPLDQTFRVSRVSGQLSQASLTLHKQLEAAELDKIQNLTSEDKWKDAIVSLNSELEDAIKIIIPSGSEERSKFWKLDLVQREEYFVGLYLPKIESLQCRDLLLKNSANLLEDMDVKKLELVLKEIFLLENNATGESIPVLEALERLCLGTAGLEQITKAYFIPPITGECAFVSNADLKEPLFLFDGQPVQVADPNSSSLSNSQTVKCETKHLMSGNFDISTLQVRMKALDKPIGVQDRIVPFNLFEMYSKVIDRLGILQRLMTVSKVNLQELQYFTQNPAENVHIDYRDLEVTDLIRLHDYTQLRDRAPVKKTEISPVLKALLWCQKNDTKIDVIDKVANALQLPLPHLTDFVNSKYPGKSSGDLALVFQEPSKVLEVAKALHFKARLGLSDLGTESLFLLAEPTRPQTLTQTTWSDEIRSLQQAAKKSLSTSHEDQQSRYEGILDKLAEQRRAVLINYLLNQEFFRKLGYRDADSLFEYFLIDVQMGASLRTSRMKQAISTVQLYVQRCYLGLEKGIKGELIDKGQWEWMRSYQLWEANRKVFLYPENFLDPTLRDDKSDLFKALEARIMQANLDLDTMASAVKEYIYNLNELADLGIQAYLWDTQTSGKKLMHLFARTKNAPYQFYYRRLDIVERKEEHKLLYWSSWSKMEIDVPTYEVDAEGEALDVAGSYLIPTMRRGRVFLFIPHLLLKTLPTSSKVSFPERETEGVQAVGDVKDKNASTADPSNVRKYWEMRMGWSELRNGVWSPKRVSHAKLNIGPIDSANLSTGYRAYQDNTSTTKTAPLNGIDKFRLPSIDSFKFWIRSLAADGTAVNTAAGIQDILVVDVECWYKDSPTSELIDSKTTKFNTSYYPFGRFEMRDYDFDAIAIDKSPTEQNKETLPTRFSKVEWKFSSADEERRGKWRPFNHIHRETRDDEPLLAKVTSDDKEVKEEGVLTWTMSFDDSQFKCPTGLAVSFATRAKGNQSYLVFPSAELDKTTQTSGITEQLDNMVAPHLMEVATSSEGLDAVFQWLQTMPEKLLFDAFGSRNGPIYHEQASPNAIYNWELGFHIVSLLMERLFATQQFELALQVARFVFDPTRSGTDLQSCWLFPPFAEPKIAKMETAEHILNQLEPKGKSPIDSAIAEWRRHPYAAHSIARNRPVAYMKNMVKTYIRILVASGDYYFRQNTLEAMHLAIQRYIEASHLFGAPPTKMPRIGKPKVQTFNGLEKVLNSFSNASLDIELEFPFMREPALRGYPRPSTKSEGLNRGLIGLFKSGYFCVPANPDLSDLRFLIDDRLQKIRNGQDIDGKSVSRLLWEPSLDPMDLVRAQAKGKTISSVLVDALAPMPNYRFYYLLQKANELCGELKSMGEQLISTREKRDNEALTLFRQTQEININSMMMDIKKYQRDEAAKTLEGLYETRKSHESRLSYYLKLIGEKDRGLGEGKPWNEIEQSIEKPTPDDLRMTSHEKLEMDSSAEAAALGMAASTLDSVAAGLLALPKVMANVEPMGVGASMQFDATNVAHFMMGTSGVMKLFAQFKGDQASRAARTAQLVRQLQERRLQANQAGSDIVQVDKQIEAQKIRLLISENEIKLQQKQVEHSNEMDRWFKSKYTSEKLYAWMENSSRKLYYDTYLLASDLARKAKAAFDFEKGRGSSKMFESSGYWDENRDGMFSAQNLYINLKRMEMAYMEAKSHDYEITKAISLRQVQPLALLALRETGTAQFTLPEVLFDIDFPGHYLRRIKSVALTVPCIVGPYTSLNCTLDLMEHRTRVSPVCKSENDYLHKGREDPRFRSDPFPISSIALSQGQNDSGVFELSFAGERYLPFEGAGVISTWKLSIPDPKVAPQFDYDTISDVILHIKYTSLRGPVSLTKAASTSVSQTMKGLVKEGTFYSCLDLKNDFPNAWFAMVKEKGPDAGAGAVLTLDHIDSRLPFWTKGQKITTRTISLLVNHGKTDRPTITFGTSSSDEFIYRDRWGKCTLLQLVKAANATGTWSLKLVGGSGGTVDIERLFMVIEYVVG